MTGMGRKAELKKKKKKEREGEMMDGWVRVTDVLEEEIKRRKEEELGIMRTMFVGKLRKA